MELKRGQQMLISGLSLCVSGGQNNWYLEYQGGYNDAIFKKLGITDKEAFVKKAVGYSPLGGTFPTVKTLKDLSKVVDALKGSENELTFTIEDYRTHINVACSKWKDEIFEGCGQDLLENGSSSLSKEMIDGMIEDANSSQMKVLQKLFPSYMSSKGASTSNMNAGEVIQTPQGYVILFTGDYWVDLKDYDVWDEDPEYVGKIVEVEIKVK